MKALAHRLRLVSLVRILYEDQNIFTARSKSLAKLRQILPSLDACGSKHALIAECYPDLSSSTSIPPSLLAFALHSSSVDALMDCFIPATVPGIPGAQHLARLNFESRTSNRCGYLREILAPIGGLQHYQVHANWSIV